MALPAFLVGYILSTWPGVKCIFEMLHCLLYIKLHGAILTTLSEIFHFLSSCLASKAAVLLVAFQYWWQPDIIYVFACLHQ